MDIKFKINKTRFLTLILFLITLQILIFELNFVNKEVKVDPKKPMLSLGAIEIEGNFEFESWAAWMNWTGDGTKENPYIIEDITFDGLDSEICLDITETSVYFIVRNCTFINSGGTLGIHLRDVGNATIYKNILSNDHYHGIEILYCNNINITENTANYNSQTGIKLYFCTNITVSDNFLNNNGYSGLHVSFSDNIICMNNTAKNSIKGFHVQQTNNTKIIRNNLKNNTNEGLYISQCFKNEFLENTINENQDGIYLSNSHNNTFSENTINSNERAGMRIWMSNFNLIRDNTLIGNDPCFSIDESEENVFENNNCQNSQGETTIPGYYTPVLIGILFALFLFTFKKRYKIRNLTN